MLRGKNARWAHETFNDTWRHDWLYGERDPELDGPRRSHVATDQGLPGHLHRRSDAEVVGPIMVEFVESGRSGGNGPTNLAN